VSTDASLFPIHFFDCEIFCEICAQLKKFKVFSQEKYDKNYGKSEIPPNKPLFCRCGKCSSTVIYATGEFAELQENPKADFSKIWELGNPEIGEQVFHPEHGVCTVDGMDRVYDSLCITLKNQNDEKIKIQVEKPFAGNSNEFYRLFPQDAENARIGDLIYHTETKLAGKVIGLQFNGRQTIIVEFENEKIAKYHCDDSYYLTDAVLEKNAAWWCRDLFFLPNLHISSNSKILSINCIAPNYKAICELNKIISSIPQVRCIIAHITVEKLDINLDDVYRKLIRNYIHICDCHIEAENQEIYISGFYSNRDIPANVYRILSKYPLKKIILDIKMRTDMKTIKTINESDHFIKISRMGKKVHIDGWVRSEKEKRKAKLKAFFCSFTFRIENHLWVIS